MYTAGSVQWVYSHCTAWLQVWRGAASVCLEPGGAQQWSSAAQYWQCPTVAHSVPLYLSRPGPAVQQESSILHPLGQRAVTSELSSCFSLSSQSVKIQDEQHIQTRIVYSNFSVLWLSVRRCPASVYLWELRGDSDKYFLDMIIALFGNLKKCQILRFILLAWKRFPENKQTLQANLCNCCLVLKNLKFGRSSF